MFWQVDCNNGGDHNFGFGDKPQDARCVVCQMSPTEIRKRRISNRIIQMFEEDPYARYGRDSLRKKLNSAIRLLNKLDEIDP